MPGIKVPLKHLSIYHFFPSGILWTKVNGTQSLKVNILIWTQTEIYRGKTLCFWIKERRRIKSQCSEGVEKKSCGSFFLPFSPLSHVSPHKSFLSERGGRRQCEWQQETVGAKSNFSLFSRAVALRKPGQTPLIILHSLLILLLLGL